MVTEEVAIGVRGVSHQFGEAGEQRFVRALLDTSLDVSRGELLCHAFETYREMIPSSQISFEHAVFLATTLSRGEQLRLGGCTDCGSLVVTERFPIRDKRCHHCANSTA